MSELFLNDLLHLTKEEISNSKIELNMNAGSHGKPFIDEWLKHSDSEKEAGLCKCSYWTNYGGKRNFYPGQLVFSFVRLSSDDWLFISAGKIIEVPTNTFASPIILDQYRPLFGRLIIKCKKGNTYARYTFKMSKYIDTAIVKEVLPCLYSGEHFEGYDKVNLPFSKLDDIFSGRILPTYYEALSKVAGVYCLTDTKTGNLYVGSATGEEGVAQRWGNYLSSKHGGNKKLVELHKERGDSYFSQYFTFTLLEYFNLSYDSNKILDREQYWKRCLDTIKHGYNDN